MSKIESQICKVCELLDSNTTEQECKFCSFCDAWICLKDYNDPIRRGKAVLKELKLKRNDN